MQLLYDPSKSLLVDGKISDSFALHLWNKMRHWGGEKQLVVNQDQPLYGIFAEHCPHTEAELFRKRLGLPYNRR